MRIDYKSLEEYCGDVEGEDQVKRDEQRKQLLAKLREEAKLEQVYVGALMIHDAFPDVFEIEETILNVFSELSSDRSPARRIRKLAWSLENVQYRRVTQEGNCVSEEWHRVFREFRRKASTRVLRVPIW